MACLLVSMTNCVCAQLSLAPTVSLPKNTLTCVTISPKITCTIFPKITYKILWGLKFELFFCIILGLKLFDLMSDYLFVERWNQSNGIQKKTACPSHNMSSLYPFTSPVTPSSQGWDITSHSRGAAVIWFHNRKRRASNLMLHTDTVCLILCFLLES